MLRITTPRIVPAQRRDLVDAHTEEHQREDDALQRFAVAAMAIDEAWTEGARRVWELEQLAGDLADVPLPRNAG
jgi:hypothetical protein